MSQTRLPDLSLADNLPDPQATITRADGRARVTLVGEVDADLRGYLDAVVDLAADSGDHIELDLSQVTFFCAEGARFLANLRRAAPGGVVTVVGMSPPTRSVLETCGIIPVAQKPPCAC